MASKSSSNDFESQIPTFFGPEVVNTTDEDDFQHTIELLQGDALSNEISNCVEEVSSLRVVNRYFERLRDTFKIKFFCFSSKVRSNNLARIAQKYASRKVGLQDIREANI